MIDPKIDEEVVWCHNISKLRNFENNSTRSQRASQPLKTPYKTIKKI